MKTMLLLALTLLKFAVAPSAAPAWDSCRGFSHDARVPVSTREVCRSTHRRWATNASGHLCSYEVTVVTYADTYGDGSNRRYTRTFLG